MLEELIKQLIAALDRNTAAQKGAAVESPKTEAPETEEKPNVEKKVKKEKTAEKPKDEPSAPAVTLDQLREHGQKLLDAGQEPKIREISGKFNVKRLRDIDPKDYAEALKLLEAATKGLSDSSM